MRILKYIAVLAFCLSLPSGARAELRLYPFSSHGEPCFAECTIDITGMNCNWSEPLYGTDYKVIKCIGESFENVSRTNCSVYQTMNPMDFFSRMACRFYGAGVDISASVYVCGHTQQACRVCYNDFDDPNISLGYKDLGTATSNESNNRVKTTKKTAMLSVEYSCDPPGAPGPFSFTSRECMVCQEIITETATWTCAANYYKASDAIGESIDCRPCRDIHATCPNIGDDFTCDKGYYKSGYTCVKCPVGTTKGSGATSPAACIVPEDDPYCFDDGIGTVCYADCQAK